MQEAETHAPSGPSAADENMMACVASRYDPPCAPPTDSAAVMKVGYASV